jgi:D-glycero-D-manno-heptose 1,7-bisphosphate phosphatase
LIRPVRLQNSEPGVEADGCCYHSGVTDSQGSASKGTLRTVFLDRDGVLNEKMPEGKYVTGWTEFRALPGVTKALARLKAADLRIIVVSNQRGIALGLYSAADVEAIHTNFQKSLQAGGAGVDAFYFCPHDKQECDCRKPLPGMFEQARQDFPEITAAESVMIGDSLSDIEFGKRLGMRTVFIEGDLERRKPGAEKAAELADERFGSLTEAVEAILRAR